jgi:hypothetical protein
LAPQALFRGFECRQLVVTGPHAGDIPCLTISPLAGCQNEGPAEKAGRAVDDALNK